MLQQFDGDDQIIAPVAQPVGEVLVQIHGLSFGVGLITVQGQINGADVKTIIRQTPG